MLNVGSGEPLTTLSFCQTKTSFSFGSTKQKGTHILTSLDTIWRGRGSILQENEMPSANVVWVDHLHECRGSAGKTGVPGMD